MHSLLQSRAVFQYAIKVRLLDYRAGGLIVNSSSHGLNISAAIPPRDNNHFQPSRKCISLQYLQVFGVYGVRDDHLAAPFAAHTGQAAGLGQSTATVIQRGIGDIQTGQFADHGLILKYGLQYALADLRLIRGIGGIELRAQQELFKRSRNVVVISPCSQETRVVLGIDIFCRQFFQMVAQFHFPHARGQPQLAFNL